MGHVAVLSLPIDWLHFFSYMVKHLTGWHHLHGLGVQHFLCYQHLAVLVVGFLAIVDKEADTGGVKLTSEVWKNWSQPPLPSFLPFCRDSCSVSAVSLAASKASHTKTSCKALFMAHTYSNVVMDKIEECIKK